MQSNLFNVFSCIYIYIYQPQLFNLEPHHCHRYQSVITRIFAITHCLSSLLILLKPNQVHLKQIYVCIYTYISQRDPALHNYCMYYLPERFLYQLLLLSQSQRLLYVSIIPVYICVRTRTRRRRRNGEFKYIYIQLRCFFIS